MKMSKKVALGAVVASILTLGVPMTAANADSSDTRHGMCYYAPLGSQALSGRPNEGEIGVDAEMITPANVPDANAEIDCKLVTTTTDVPFSEIDVRANVLGGVFGQLQFPDDHTATSLCENDLSGDGSSSGWVCTPVPAEAGGACNTVAGQVVCVSLTATTPQGTYGISPPDGGSGPDAGSIDTYQFTVPGGGIVTLPCVVLVSGATTVDPCAAAGGTYVATLAALSDAPTTPIAAVHVCNANLVLTVDGIGVNSFPNALILC